MVFYHINLYLYNKHFELTHVHHQKLAISEDLTQLKEVESLKVYMSMLSKPHKHDDPVD